MSITEITTDEMFAQKLTCNKMCLIDYFATWCGPCTRIQPKLKELAANYPAVAFFKVDVDVLQEVAASNGVSAMPTFIVYQCGRKVDSLRGADPSALEALVKKWAAAAAAQSPVVGAAAGPVAGEPDTSGVGVGVKGQMDLLSMINNSACECLNECDDHSLQHCLAAKGGFLQSDCDEQLIIYLVFSQAVRLHSLKVHAPLDKGPRKMKIFANLPVALDFDQVERMSSVQDLDLKLEDLEEDSVVSLKYVKFQNVQNVLLFVQNNQEGGDVTQIDYLCIIGMPVATTNMNEFKRVAGEAGESH